MKNKKRFLKAVAALTMAAAMTGSVFAIAACKKDKNNDDDTKIETPITYTVTFDLNYETTNKTSQVTVNDGGKATKTDPTRTGYTFDGWYTAVTGGTKVDLSTYTVSGNVTLYAHWTEVSEGPSDPSGGGSGGESGGGTGGSGGESSGGGESDTPTTKANVTLNAGDLSTGTLTNGQEIVEGVKASGDGIAVEGNSKDVMFGGSTVKVAKRIKLDKKLSDSNTPKGFEVNLEAAATILVYAYSGSSGSERNLAFYDSAKEEISAVNIGDGNYMNTALFEAEADTTYYIGAKDTGINIYYIAIFYSGFEETWTPHDAVAATCEDEGNIEYSSSNYGRYKDGDDNIIAYHKTKTNALGAHNFSIKGGTLQTPTENDPGSVTLTCATGNEEVQVTLPKLSSPDYKTRPEVGQTGNYQYEYKNYTIEFTATGVAEKQPTYTNVLEYNTFTGVEVGSSKTEGANCVYKETGTVEVTGSGGLRFGDASNASKGYIALGTAITSGIVKISGSIKVETTDQGKWTFFQIFDNNGEGDNEVIGFRTGSKSGGTAAWGYRLGGTGDVSTAPIAANATMNHTFEIIINFEAQTVSITVDNTKLATDASLTINSIVKVGAANINAGRFMTLNSLTIGVLDED